MHAPRVGLTLPSFVRDADEVLAVARAADEAGLDGVFAYDHLFRVTRDGTRRPALECTAVLGAVAAETTRVRVGALVMRASLRPAAVTALTLSTVQRIAGGRLIGGLGAGDSESERENEQFGLDFGSVAERVADLRAAVVASRDRGFPVWVGGLHPDVRDLASDQADGWNRWGGTVERFAAQAGAVTARASRPGFECSWGGLVVLGPDDEAARAKADRLGSGTGTIVGGPAAVARALAAYAAAGAGWLVVGPVDSRDPANADLLGEVRARLASAVAAG